MKKHIFLGAALLSLFAASCSNEDVINNDSESQEGQTISLQANITGGSGTRMTYVDDAASKVLKFSWSDAESFNLYKGTGSTPYEFSKTDNGNIFTGTIPGGGTDTYYAVYGKNITNNNGVLDVDIANQTGSASAENGITTFMLAQAKYLTQASGMTPTLDFQHKLTVLKLTLTLPGKPSAAKAEKIIISGLHNKASYTLSDGSYTYADGGKGEITVTNGGKGFTIDTGNKITAYVAVFPEDMAAGQVNIIANVGEDEYRYSIARKFTAGKVTPVTVSMSTVLKKISGSQPSSAEIKAAIGKGNNLFIALPDGNIKPSDYDYYYNITGGYANGSIYVTLPNQSTLPNGKSWGVFYNCQALKSVSAPLVKSVGFRAFRKCEYLTTIDLPLVESVGNEAFYNCTSLTTINLPLAESVGETAFCHCDSLTTIDLPLAKSVGQYAFSICHALTTLKLPSATEVASKPFGDYPGNYAPKIDLTVKSGTDWWKSYKWKSVKNEKGETLPQD